MFKNIRSSLNYHSLFEKNVFFVFLSKPLSFDHFCPISKRNISSSCWPFIHNIEAGFFFVFFWASNFTHYISVNMIFQAAFFFNPNSGTVR